MATPPLSKLITLSAPPRRHGWLLLIAAFKLLQALLFAAAAAGAFHFLHKDIGDELGHIARLLLFRPEARLLSFLIEKASLLNDQWLLRLGTLFSVYALLDLIEGIGLYLEKLWAEYLTLLVTGSFLPMELFEIARRITWAKSGVFTVNLLVFLYLLRLVAERQKAARAEVDASEN